jgi:iron complex outermembrane receptor protein
LPAPWQAENLGHVNFTGVEASFEFRLRQQRFDVAYTGLYGQQNALGQLQSLYVFNYPSNDAVLRWQGKLPWNFVARTRVGVVKRYASDPYALWDASLGREFKNLSAHLALANLTNTGYREIQGVAMPGRSVVFGMDVFIRTKKH